MLTRVVVQNYRPIADLTLHLDAKTLLMGHNGSGKSSLFDALSSVRDILVEGEECEEVLPLATLPRWLPAEQNAVRQKIELEVSSNWGTLTYTLVVDQDRQNAQSRILTELLQQEGKPLFSFQRGRVQLYRDDHSEGPTYSSDWTRSAMRPVPPAPENSKMTWFKERVRGIHCLRIDAPRMSARSEKEAATPARDFSNFASWYWRALVSDASAGAAFLAAVKDVVGGMDSLNLTPLGQGIVVLEASLYAPKEPSGLQTARRRKYKVDFGELSDGQRALVGLYAMIHFLLRENTTLCIDEPDNFVALAELQPWLNSLMDLVDENGAQVILASHHPEMFNLLAPEHGIVLERSGAGPTTAKRYKADPDSPLTPAERAARGRLG